MNEQFKKFLEMIVSMTVDCLMEGITTETYMTNLKTAIPLMEKALNEENK